MGAINILIGPNGAGKSNFIGLFRLIQQMLGESLQVYVSKQGGPDSILHFGRKNSEHMSLELYFGNNGYLATWEPTNDNRMVFVNESFWWNRIGAWSIGQGHFETNFMKGTKTGIDKFVKPGMLSWRVYHFHDTSDSAFVKQMHRIDDNNYLRPDGRNLAAFLYLLRKRHENAYLQIVKAVQLVAPFFKDFCLKPQNLNPDFIELEWYENGQETPFKADQLSDGTLRFICLATVFLQPHVRRPSTIIVDEPELGLHPYAISVLAALVQSAATQNQVILSTQSVELLNEFDAEDVVVTDRVNNASVFRRLDAVGLAGWLEDYSLGELWKKNLLGGRPRG